MEQNKKNSIMQAAKASWVIPLVNLGFIAFTNSIIKSSNSPISTLALGGIEILFFIVGIICGVIGLSGIRQHGTKSILAPSIIGILLNGIFLFILLAVAITTYQKATIGG